MTHKLALVVGGAACVWEDLERARALATFDLTVVVNDVGTVWAGHIDHWVSYHAGLLKHWEQQRAQKGLPPATLLWSGPAGRERVQGLQYHKHAGGSSGLLATHIAVDCASKAVLVGIPMDPNMTHWNERRGSKVPWKAGIKYLHCWENSFPRLVGRARSMSGWTAERLGTPDEQWLNET